MTNENCRNCGHGIWDGKAPLVYCKKRGEFIPPIEDTDCGFFIMADKVQAPVEHDGAPIILHDFSIQGLIVCDDTTTVLSVVNEILRESPTLQKLYRRMTTHKIVLPSGKEDVDDGKRIN